MWGRVVMVQRYPQRKSVSRWLEYAIYFVLLTLLTNAFLGMWARLREGPEAVGAGLSGGGPYYPFYAFGGLSVSNIMGDGFTPQGGPVVSTRPSSGFSSGMDFGLYGLV
jgi:hypothetical protein